MRTNHLLAILAVIAGISAAFTSYSVKNSLYPTKKFEHARVDGQRLNYISPYHLADLIYRKQPVILLDTREGEAYEDYHIPTALPYHGEQKMEEEKERGMVILYGAGEDEDVYSLAKDLPGRVFVLKGGMEAWSSLVLFPDLVRYRVRNSEQLRYIVRRAGFFGGEAQNTQLLNIQVRESRYREGC